MQSKTPQKIGNFIIIATLAVIGATILYTAWLITASPALKASQTLNSYVKSVASADYEIAARYVAKPEHVTLFLNELGNISTDSKFGVYNQPRNSYTLPSGAKALAYEYYTAGENSERRFAVIAVNETSPGTWRIVSVKTTNDLRKIEELVKQ